MGKFPGERGFAASAVLTMSLTALKRRDPERARAVYAEEIESAYRIAPGALVASSAGAALLAFGLYRGAPPRAAILWLATLLAWTLAVALLCMLRHRSRPSIDDAPIWGHRFTAALFIQGCIWGAAGVVMFSDELTLQLMLGFALFLVTVSGISAGVYLPSAYAFNIPVLAPFIIRMSLVDDSYHLALAGGMLILLILMFYYAGKLNNLVVNSINIRFENAELNEALTEQRVQERTRILEAASQHKSEFLANMSHELRTPLNAIIGFSEVLKDGLFGQLNDKQEEYIQDVHAAGHHLLALINDILDLSKVEAGRMELSVSKFDIPSAIDNAVMLVRERASRHQLALEVKVDARLNSFTGDERKFKQILLNLLSNAVKFTPEGGKVAVAAQPIDNGVQVSVSDSGIGIAPEHQQAIFEAFHQVNGNFTTKGEGTGLGLTLVKQFVEMHGGRVWLDSAPAQGSTFTFTLEAQPWQSH